MPVGGEAPLSKCHMKNGGETGGVGFFAHLTLSDRVASPNLVQRAFSQNGLMHQDFRTVYTSHRGRKGPTST